MTIAIERNQQTPETTQTQTQLPVLRALGPNAQDLVVYVDRANGDFVPLNMTRQQAGQYAGTTVSQHIGGLGAFANSTR